MHVIDVLLDSFTRLFRHHRYSPLKKLFILWALERLGMTYFLRKQEQNREVVQGIEEQD
jgi:hypothetical protein